MILEAKMTEMTALQAEIEVRKLVSEYWTIIEAVYPFVGTCPKVLVTTRKSSTAGYAWKSSTYSRVEYNLTYPMTTGIEAFKEIVMHELAHIVQFRLFPKAPQAHGPEFRSIMQFLGFNGATYHRHDVAEAKAASSSIRKNGIDISGIL